MRLTAWEKQNFRPVLTCSNLSKTFHTCLQLFTPFATCSHFSDYAVRAMAVSRYNTVTMYVRRAMSFLHFQMLLFFGLTSYPGEIAYFNSPN